MSESMYEVPGRVLDDAREDAKTLKAASRAIDSLREELAHLRRTSVQIYEKCGDCGGVGHKDACELGDDGCRCGLVDDCLSCEDGLVLKDGAVRLPGYGWVQGVRTEDNDDLALIVVPASWRGTDDE